MYWKIENSYVNSFFYFSGITEENLTKLIQHAQIPNEDRDMITNLAMVGCNVVVDGNRKKIWQIKRKKRINDQTYQMSRWTPVLKDIIEDCIDDKLDNSHFPFLGGIIKYAQFSCIFAQFSSIIFPWR